MYLISRHCAALLYVAQDLNTWTCWLPQYPGEGRPLGMDLLQLPMGPRLAPMGHRQAPMDLLEAPADSRGAPAPTEGLWEGILMSWQPRSADQVLATALLKLATALHRALTRLLSQTLLRRRLSPRPPHKQHRLLIVDLKHLLDPQHPSVTLPLTPQVLPSLSRPPTWGHSPPKALPSPPPPPTPDLSKHPLYLPYPHCPPMVELNRPPPVRHTPQPQPPPLVQPQFLPQAQHLHLDPAHHWEGASKTRMEAEASLIPMELGW